MGFITLKAVALLVTLRLAAAQAPLYGQCGGLGWTGEITCVSGATCVVSNSYYSQCLPASQTTAATATTTTTTATKSTTTAKTTTSLKTTTTSSKTITTSSKPTTSGTKSSTTKISTTVGTKTSTTTTSTTTGGTKTSTTTISTTTGGTAPTGLIGYGSQATGGGNATPVTVTSCDALLSAINNNTPKVIKIKGILKDCGAIPVGSHTTVLGADANSGFTNTRFSVSSKKNVIIRNLIMGPAPLGNDVVTIIASTHVWIDHNTFKSIGIVGNKDDYDGLLDFTNGADYITVSWNVFKDHWKTSLTGSADTTGSTDREKFHITFHHNWYENVFSRAPLARWATAHIFNNYYHGMETSVNVRIESNVLVQNCYFEDINKESVWGTDEGAGCESGSVFVNAPLPNIARACTLVPPYSYTLEAASGVKTTVMNGAGNGKITV